MAIFSLVALRQIRREDPPSAPYVAAILLAITAFFSLLTVFGNDSNPFVRVPGGVTPADGLGMNPMLQHPGMVIHPVALYLGLRWLRHPLRVGHGRTLGAQPERRLAAGGAPLGAGGLVLPGHR